MCPSIAMLKFQSPSKWNSYEGFNFEHWLDLYIQAEKTDAPWSMDYLARNSVQIYLIIVISQNRWKQMRNPTKNSKKEQNSTRSEALNKNVTRQWGMIDFPNLEIQSLDPLANEDPHKAKDVMFYLQEMMVPPSPAMYMRNHKHNYFFSLSHNDWWLGVKILLNGMCGWLSNKFPQNMNFFWRK